MNAHNKPMLDPSPLASVLGAESEVTALALAALPRAIVVTDVQGRIELLNPAAEALLGASASRLAGRPVPLRHRVGGPLDLAASGAVTREPRCWEGLRATGPKADGALVLRVLAAPLARHGAPFQGWVLALEAGNERRGPPRDAAPSDWDPLTRLPGPGLFEDRSRQAILWVQRYGGAVGLCCVAFDGVGDGRGEVGAQFAQEVAARLRSGLRKEDSVARYPGGVFMVLLPGAGSRAGIACVARKLLDALRAWNWSGGDRPASTPRIGIAVAPDDGVDARILMGKAVTASARIGPDGPVGHRFFAAGAEALSVAGPAVARVEGEGGSPPARLASSCGDPAVT